ncbi:hypothetical protein [Rheinheimera sp.]|uniref:hypothetical protein n=1 Tax=Rheinheimera sp. TaxID=1869214 RepID=UPI0040483777
MVVNIEDLMAKKVKLSTPLFVTFIILMLMTWGYRIGAGDKAGILSFILYLAFLALSFGYPIVIFRRHLQLFISAKAAYQSYLNGLGKHELLELSRHSAIRPNSKRMVLNTGQRRFPYSGG